MSDVDHLVFFFKIRHQPLATDDELEMLLEDSGNRRRQVLFKQIIATDKAQK